MLSFKNKTAFITGASRGIGKAIALKLAAAGANIIIAAKTVNAQPNLEGTIFSAAEDIEKIGGKALAVATDIRDETQIQNAVKAGVEAFGGIDIVINNASAIQLTDTENTSEKKFNLIFDINVRGSFLVVKNCLPFLKASKQNPHILTLSPPLNMDPKWFAPHIAYTLSKYNMTMMTMGWAKEFRKNCIACNTLWPQTTIDTAAVRNLLGGEKLANKSRTPEIVAEAAFHILNKQNLQYTGQAFIDELVLKNEGINDFSKYAVNPTETLFNDLFI